MDSEPSWLDIDDQLFPQILMIKQIVFQNTHSAALTQFFTEVKYNSFKRQIDLTAVIYRYFLQYKQHFSDVPSQQCQYQILIRDKHEQKLQLVGFFPSYDSYILGEQYLSQDILYFIVKKEDKLNQDFSNLSLKEQEKDITKQLILGSLFEEEIKPQTNPSDPISKEEEELSDNLKSKTVKRRSIEEILKLIAEWRKFITIKNLSSSEAADKVNMSKRSLEDYFTIIKLAEKYGFDFESKMKNPFGELRNFVKEHHEIKPTPKVQILQKFKNSKK